MGEAQNLSGLEPLLDALTEKDYRGLRTASRNGLQAAIAKAIAITQSGDRDPVDQVITIKRIQ